MKYWQCSVCKYIHEGDTPPEKCPVCGVDSSKFIEIDEASIPDKKPRKTVEKKSSPEDKTDIVQEKAELPESEDEAKKQAAVSKQKKGYEKVVSLLIKHHAHPISVHTPNGILPAAVILIAISWFFETPLLEKAAIINLVIVLLALPFVVYTGFLEWKEKYNQARTPVFKIKILAASITCISCVISIAWYLINPQVLSSPRAWGFILINLIMVAAAGLAGHIGGKLVFKD